MLLSNSVMSGGVSVASKKPFFADLDYFLVAFLFLIVLFGSKGFAFELNAPSELIVQENTVFYIDLVNDSSSTVDLKVNFYSPFDSLVVAPKQLSPNSRTQVKISITNNFLDERIVSGLVEASFGTQIITKEIELFSAKSSNFSPNVAGLFSFGTTINEFDSFTSIDWIIFIILAVICAVLLVSFIAKLRRRV